MKRALVAFLLLVGVASFITALTLGGPSWTPSSAFTNNTLNCSWSYSGDTLAQNITFLRNGVLFNTTFENASLTTLHTSLTVDAANTTKTDVWTCRVLLDNGTTTTQTETNVTILNSPPVLRGLPAGIFNGSIEVGDLVQVQEDETLSLDANATDADGDAVTYDLLSAQFCNLVSDTLGTYSCTPTQSNIVNNSPTLRNISFVAQDPSDGVIRIVTFNVTPVNDPPVVTTSDQQTSVNISLNITFAASDIESGYPLQLQLIAPAEISDRLSLTRLNVNGTSLSVYYDASSPDFNDVGLWNVSINATDNSTRFSGSNDSKSASYNFTLNISAAGRRPYFTSIQPNGTYNISQGQVFQINISANDADANSTIVFTDSTARFNISTVSTWTNSSDARGQINFTPSNDDVGVYNVTITITDGELLTNSTTLSFNVANVNDAPSVNEISTNSSNTQSNTNASDLSAYANAPFVYVVNATDIDSAYGDTLTYTDNTSLFVINPTTGAISFTPTPAQVQAGAYHINITATDNASARASRVILLTVRDNAAPYFNITPLPQLNCTTLASCSFDLSGAAADPDAGDNVTLYNASFVGSTLSTFVLNATTGLISFTTAKTDFGNYTANITIIDSFGAFNSTILNISINNTPEAPNLTRFNFSNETLVETHAFTYELQASDNDLQVGALGENVTFATNLSISYTITPLINSSTTARALLTLTPSLGEAGNYTIHINATDRFGLRTQRNITFEIFEDVPAPNITQITPWGAANASFDVQTSYANTSDAQFSDATADVNLSENTTVLFNVSTADTRPLTFVWTVNGTSVATTRNYTHAFNFFSQGRYVVRVNVSNDRLESAAFTWDVRVRNTNRDPILVSNLSTPLVVNGTTVYTNYFLLGNATRFIDPDDDLDSSDTINGNESSTLTFGAASSCNVATLGISGGDLTVTGTEIGSCQLRFNATDAGGLTLESNLISINVTDLPEGSTETQTVVSRGGGGGSSSTSNFVPISKDKKKPQAFHLIAPKLVTIYANHSVVIPVVINNTWEGPLKNVWLSAQTNATGVQTQLDRTFFEEIGLNETREVQLTVTNYRLGENYEVLVRGNVSDPEYDDEALILLNSIQQANDGGDVNVKVTFASDLLNQHPECQELNEVLDQAKQKIAENNYDEAGRLVDGVINGCKYLVSTQQRIEEKPSKINPIIMIDNLSLKTIMWSVLAFIVLLSIALLVYYHYTHRPEEDI